MAAERPLTQREIKKNRAERSNVEKVVVLNVSAKQAINIQLKAPEGMSFWSGEQTVSIHPRKMVSLPKHRLYVDQIINLRKSGRIQVLSGLQESQ